MGAGIEAGGGGGGSNLLFRPKTASTLRNATITPTNDEELFFLSVPPGTYWFEFVLSVSQGIGSPGFRYRWDHSLTGNLSFGCYTSNRMLSGALSFTAVANIGAPGTEITAALPASGQSGHFYGCGVVLVSTVRDIRLLWAQNTSVAVNTAIQQGSWASLRPMESVN